jgi:murein L,D-transpeptidase YcbB/YkuD
VSAAALGAWYGDELLKTGELSNSVVIDVPDHPVVLRPNATGDRGARTIAGIPDALPLSETEERDSAANDRPRDEADDQDTTTVAALPDASQVATPNETEPSGTGLPASETAEPGPAGPDSADPIPPPVASHTPASETEAPGTAGPSAAEPMPPVAGPTPASETEASGTAGPAAGADTATPAAEQAAPVDTAVVEAIRLKLQDPSLRSGAHEGDLAALEAFYAERTGPALWMIETGFSPGAQAALDELGKADEWGLVSSAFAVPSAGSAPSATDAKAAAEIELNLAILKYARFARGGRTNPPSLSKIVDQQPTLRDPKSVLSEIATAEAPDAYLRSLHPKHEQFQNLRQALLKARASGGGQRDIDRLLINMERWRWMPETLGSRYVQINIPEFMAFVYKDGKRIHADKVVVGKPVYATPVFPADLKSIVFNPEWTVPPTIVREDLLPKLRGGGFRGRSVLKTHKLKVHYNGRPVNPGSINWRTVNMGAISFVQAPGPTNVLGKVKFNYPNRHIVYMHDTIKKGLMDKEVRVEGHHCPRVANPGKFAGVVLAEDQGMSPASLEKLLKDGYNKHVSLSTPIPVHTTYFTAVADGEGKVRTHGDVYGLDAAVGKALGRPASVATSSAPAVTAPASAANASSPAAAPAAERAARQPRQPDANRDAARTGTFADFSP